LQNRIRKIVYLEKEEWTMEITIRSGRMEDANIIAQVIAMAIGESIGIATNDRIHLIGGDELTILADMQAVAVDYLGNLLGAHPPVDFVFLLLARHNTSKLDSALARSSVLMCKAVEYGFFNFHRSKLHVSIES
jgi:hypothetical protein